MAWVWCPWPGEWKPTNNNEWTGIGGSADFDEATYDEARDALIAAGVDPLDAEQAADAIERAFGE